MSLFLLRDLPKYQALHSQAQRYSCADASACEACWGLLRVASDIVAALDEHLAKHELSQGRFTVMMLLNREPEVGQPPVLALSPSELAEAARVTRATMTGLLDGLQRDGMVDRCDCQHDRRMAIVHLTRKGRRKLDLVLPEYYQRVAELMQGLTAGDRGKLLELLGRIAEGLPSADAC
jgi:DNA-binding MarR family transcriptional regulator